MSYRRTFFRMAERADVHPALKKLWKKHFEVNGEVTQHLSPFEQNIMSPMYYNLAEKVSKRVIAFTLEAGPALVAGVLIYNWAEKTHKDIAYHHRS